MASQVKILIVDNDPAGRRILESLFEPLGYGLEFATTGGEALAKTADLVPDLIILDVMLPGLDGFEVCRRFRTNPRLAEVPIVLVTALNDRAARLRGFDEGADDFITKPYDREELRGRVRGIIRLNRYRTLVAERERFERITRLSPVGILIVDAGGIVKFANSAMTTLLKAKDPNAVIGQDHSIFIAPEAYISWLNFFMGALSLGDGTVRCETSLVSFDDRTLIVEIEAGGFEWDGATAVQLVVRDVTEQRRLEMEANRTQRMETIGSLAGGVAHDLNNVLTPVLMGIELLRDNVSREQREILDMMEAAARRGSGMVKQVLAFAKGRTFTRDILKPCHLIRDIQSITETFPRSIVVKTSLSDDLWPILGDATEVSQVLLNLCVNARDAMPEGGTLDIAAKNVTIDDDFINTHLAGRCVAPGHYVAVAVSDSGNGIPPDIRERIFDRFFTTKETGKGTGIGLSTVKTIVDKHGGFIEVASEVGCGTTFRTYFPAVLEPGGAESPMPCAPPPMGHGERVLIVDDEHVIRRMTATTLETFGYSVRTCADGEEALAACGEFVPALVVVDLHLPRVRGTAVIGVLGEKFPTVPVLAMTGLLGDEEAVAARAAGARDILAKPFTAEELARTIAAVLN